MLPDIKCYRINGRAIVEGVEHNIMQHSPDGFEWGFGGSGPAELALNILSQYLSLDDAQKYHQNFKWQFITPIPEAGGVIKRDEIISWIVHQLRMEKYKNEEKIEELMRNNQHETRMEK